MSSAVDVARYILDQREARGHMTTTFALQKLLYYCQSWNLVGNDEPLFDDVIEAWEHGPVVRSVAPYCSGRHYIFAREIPCGRPDEIPTMGKLLIDKVLGLYEDVDDSCLGDDLEAMSHAELPWADARKADDKTISTQSMLDYYSAVQANPTIEHAAPVPPTAEVSKRTFITESDAAWLANLLAG